MSITTQGWGSGAITTVGWGVGVAVAPRVPVRARGFSGELLSFIVDFRVKQLCIKQDRAALQNRVTTTLASYATMDSDLTVQEMDLRDLTRQLRILYRQRRRGL